MNSAMAVSSSVLRMTISASISEQYLQYHSQHVPNLQCKWRCSPRPLSIRFRASASSGRKKGRSFPNPEKLQKDEEDDDDLADAALESLFSQLEKDLEKDELSDDEDITEEEMAKFEEELSELSDIEADDEKALPDYSTLELEDWQLEKLAAALNLGRRKASIKKLTAEVGLEREIVLELLRNPPPRLLLFQDSDVLLSDKDNIESSESESNPSDSISPSLVETEAQNNEPESPIYMNLRGWRTKKRFKKVQIATLEKVYQCTRRPT
ncbi:hypothetical protein KI387_029468, partial [Taxus chinensis]